MADTTVCICASIDLEIKKTKQYDRHMCSVITSSFRGLGIRLVSPINIAFKNNHDGLYINKSFKRTLVRRYV